MLCCNGGMGHLYDEVRTPAGTLTEVLEDQRVGYAPIQLLGAPVPHKGYLVVAARGQLIVQMLA